MRRYAAIIILSLLVSGCDYININVDCYRGNVIMSSCCTGSTFIDIDSSVPIGKATKVNGKDYKNVIQVPGYFTEGEIFLRLRAFDRQKDYSLFPPIQCYCLIAIGLDVPVWVATAHSASACPQPGSN